MTTHLLLRLIDDPGPKGYRADFANRGDCRLMESAVSRGLVESFRDDFGRLLFRLTDKGREEMGEQHQSGTV